MRFLHVITLSAIFTVQSMAVAYATSSDGKGSLTDKLRKQYEEQLNKVAPDAKKVAPDTKKVAPVVNPYDKTNLPPEMRDNPEILKKLDEAKAMSDALERRRAADTSASKSYDMKESFNSKRIPEVEAMARAIAAQSNTLMGEVSTSDIEPLIDYVKAVSMMVKPQSLKGTSLEDTLIKNLGSQSASISKQLELMNSTGRNLKVLQLARREVGSEALAETIDDYKQGGNKIKRGLRNAYDRLSARYHKEADRDQKARIRKAIDLLSEHSRSDMPSKVVGATLSSFTGNGKSTQYISGKHIAEMFEGIDGISSSFQESGIAGPETIRGQ